MGSIVGGGFGFVIGLYTAVTTRSIIAIPISTIVSGASFGFILGCGSLVRNQEFDSKDIENIIYMKY